MSGVNGGLYCFRLMCICMCVCAHWLLKWLKLYGLQLWRACFREHSRHDKLFTFCLSNALHSSIGHNIKSPASPMSDVSCPVTDVRSKCEKLQMHGHNSATRYPRSTSCLVLGWFFLASTGYSFLKLNCSRVT